MTMIVLIHIGIALASILAASYGFVRPSARKVAVSYGFIVATLISGTAMVVISSASILHACAVGLVYTAITTAVTVAMQVRVRRTTPAL